jgi:arylsulfatase A-like enzyme
VLLLTVDTFRADRAGCMGHPGGLTPALDRLARAGLHARDAYASAPFTAASHASILTGLEPPTHGVRENGSTPLPEDVSTLASFLRERDFRTAAFIAALPIGSRLGYDTGFDTFDEALSAPEGGGEFFPERQAAEIVDAVLAWLDEVRPGERWFAWAHFFDPHFPRRVLPALRELPVDSDYDREIRGMDVEIRRLMRGVIEWGGGRPPVTVVVSDHGEALGDHGEATHGILLHAETMQGLLSVSAPPGSEEADRLDRGIRLATSRYTDIVPTVLDLVGADVPQELAGTSWVDPSATPQGAYGESYYSMLHYGWSPLLSWRDERWTYVESPSPELFDRRSDPGELHNVIGEHPDVAARMAAQIDAIAREPRRDSMASIDPVTRERLRALGYVSGGGQKVDRSKNPKELIGVINDITDGLHQIARGNPQDALPHFQSAYRRDPENVTILVELAGCLGRLGDVVTALSYYRRAVTIDPQRTQAWAQLARLHFERGDRRRAFELLREGFAHNPESVPLLSAQGDFHRRLGELREAEAVLLRATEREPWNPGPWVGLARLAEGSGEPGKAERRWRYVVENWPWHQEIPPRFR